MTFLGNINEEEFVQIFVKIFEGEESGEQKTEWAMFILYKLPIVTPYSFI